MRDTEGTGWDSDRSIATSLFVEVLKFAEFGRANLND